MSLDDLSDLDFIKEAEEIVDNAFRDEFIPVLMGGRELDEALSIVTWGIHSYLGIPTVRSRGLEISLSKGVFRLRVYFPEPPASHQEKEEKFSELKQKLESYEYMLGASASVESIQPYGKGYELTIHFHLPE